jgi:hypothetical protein
MKYLFLLVLLVSTIGMCTGQDQYTCPVGGVFYTYSMPEGWSILGMGCCGLAASDSANPARGIIALNHLHVGFNMLPAYTTPESYMESYMPQDFSQGSSKITNMRILFNENNQDLANAFASYSGFLASGKSMRCSFEVNGIPAEGSFTVVTRELAGYGTTVDLLAGIFAPADEFDQEASMLIDVWRSIKLIPSYRNLCTPSPPCLSWQYKCDDMCCNWPCNAETNRCY